jgi:hypothetical protein
MSLWKCDHQIVSTQVPPDRQETRDRPTETSLSGDSDEELASKWESIDDENLSFDCDKVSDAGRVSAASAGAAAAFASHRSHPEQKKQMRKNTPTNKQKKHKHKRNKH